MIAINTNIKGDITDRVAIPIKNMLLGLINQG